MGVSTRHRQGGRKRGRSTRTRTKWDRRVRQMESRQSCCGRRPTARHQGRPGARVYQVCRSKKLFCSCRPGQRMDRPRGRMNGIATVIMTPGATAKRGHCERKASGARDVDNITAAKERSARMGPHQRRGEGGQRDGRSAAGRGATRVGGECGKAARGPRRRRARRAGHHGGSAVGHTEREQQGEWRRVKAAQALLPKDADQGALLPMVGREGGEGEPPAPPWDTPSGRRYWRRTGVSYEVALWKARANGDDDWVTTVGTTPPPEEPTAGRRHERRRTVAAWRSIRRVLSLIHI